ncbi:hypothetical protein Tco_0849059 [Tanacetum coccineum]
MWIIVVGDAPGRTFSSMLENEIDDNTIPDHQYLLDTSQKFQLRRKLSGDPEVLCFLPRIASQASKPATPATPFVHKSRPPSQVLASLRKVNAVFPQFEGEYLSHVPAYTETINALTAAIANWKSELRGKKSGGSTTSEKPKVLASGMYNKQFKVHSTSKKSQLGGLEKHQNHHGNTIRQLGGPSGKGVGSVMHQWKPHGRHFALYDKCPLLDYWNPLLSL